MIARSVEIDDSAERIRQRMRLVRAASLHCGMRPATMRVVNWRRIYENHPWACLGVAVAVGYLSAPRPVRVVTVSPAAIAEGSAKEDIVYQFGLGPGGAIRSLVGILGTIGIRMAVAGAGEQMARMFAPQRAVGKMKEDARASHHRA